MAEAQQWATSFNGAEIAFMNPGGVRSDLTIQMSGAEIIAVLEEQFQPLGSSRPFLHLGVSEGLTYTLDKTITAGVCTSVTLSDVMLWGEPPNEDGSYVVTVNNFLAHGGANFTTFSTVQSVRLDGGNDPQALVEYLGTFSPVAPPSTDRVIEN